MTKYSISEIDQMRALLEGCARYPSDDMKRAAIIEDRLRTHMQNGTTVFELEEAVTEFRVRINKEFAEFGAKHRA